MKSYQSQESLINLNSSEQSTQLTLRTNGSLEDHNYDVVSTSKEVPAYMAGYIVRKLELKCKSLLCLNTLQLSHNELNSHDLFIHLMEKYGGLSRASDDLFKLTQQLEAAFLDVDGRVGIGHGIIY